MPDFCLFKVGCCVDMGDEGSFLSAFMAGDPRSSSPISAGRGGIANAVGDFSFPSNGWAGDDTAGDTAGGGSLLFLRRRIFSLKLAAMLWLVLNSHPSAIDGSLPWSAGRWVGSSCKLMCKGSNNMKALYNKKNARSIKRALDVVTIVFNNHSAKPCKSWGMSSVALWNWTSMLWTAATVWFRYCGGTDWTSSGTRLVQASAMLVTWCLYKLNLPMTEVISPSTTPFASMPKRTTVVKVKSTDKMRKTVYFPASLPFHFKKRSCQSWSTQAHKSSRSSSDTWHRHTLMTIMPNTSHVFHTNSRNNVQDFWNNHSICETTASKIDTTTNATTKGFNSASNFCKK
mmetsp:Transcript_47933/g.145797  ORF Transcript_47933/g.145797 Transcript_47933/m.145797 type:complete len:343 (+) Transcript_47933:742-1770(+)